MWNPLYKSGIVAVEAKAAEGVRFAQGSPGLFYRAEETERTQWDDLPSDAGTKPHFLVGSAYQNLKQVWKLCGLSG